MPFNSLCEILEYHYQLDLDYCSLSILYVRFLSVWQAGRAVYSWMLSILYVRFRTYDGDGEKVHNDSFNSLCEIPRLRSCCLMLRRASFQFSM